MSTNKGDVEKILGIINQVYHNVNCLNSGSRQLSFSDLEVKESYNTDYVIRWKTDMITWELMNELQICLSLLTGYFEGILQLSLSTTSDNYIYVECWI